MTEVLNRKLWMFVIQGVIITTLLMGLVASTNYIIDDSEVIGPSINAQMARLSLDGNVVSPPP